MLNKMINIINNIEYGKPDFDPSELNELGFRICYNTALLEHLGGASALSCLEEHNGEYVCDIYVDDLFLNLTIEEKVFIIFHELGHKKHNIMHKDGTLFDVYNSPLEIEIEADSYAVENVGAEYGIIALENTIETMSKFGAPYEALEEGRQRLSYMKKMNNLQ